MAQGGACPMLQEAPQVVAASVASPGGSGPAVPDREVPMPVRLRRQLSAAHFAGVLRRASAAGQQQALTRTRSCTGVPAPPSSPASVGGQQSESASGCGLQPSLPSPLAAQHCTAAPPAHTLPAGFGQGQQQTLAVTHSDAECSLHHLPLPDALYGAGGPAVTVTTSVTAPPLRPGDAPTAQGAAWRGGGGGGSAASLGPPIRAAAAPQLTHSQASVPAAAGSSEAANNSAKGMQAAAANQAPGTPGAGAGSGSGSGSRRGGTRTQAAAGRGVRQVAGAGAESGRGGVGVGLKRTASMKAVSAAAHKRRAAEAAATQQPKQEQRELQPTASATISHSLQQQLAQQRPMPALPEQQQQQQQQQQAASPLSQVLQATLQKEVPVLPDVAALTMQMDWGAAGSRSAGDEPGAGAEGAAPPGRAADGAGLGLTTAEAAARFIAAGAGQQLQQPQQGLEERTGCVPRGAEGEDEAQMLLRKEKNRQAARRCREKRMQEKQLVQQQALEQAQQNEQLRAQVSGLSQRCGQEQSFRQELRGSLQALAHSIGAAPVSPPMELCQDFLGQMLTALLQHMDALEARYFNGASSTAINNDTAATNADAADDTPGSAPAIAPAAPAAGLWGPVAPAPSTPVFRAVPFGPAGVAQQHVSSGDAALQAGGEAGSSSYTPTPLPSLQRSAAAQVHPALGSCPMPAAAPGLTEEASLQPLEALASPLHSFFAQPPQPPPQPPPPQGHHQHAHMQGSSTSSGESGMHVQQCCEGDATVHQPTACSAAAAGMQCDCRTAFAVLQQQQQQGGQLHQEQQQGLQQQEQHQQHQQHQHHQHHQHHQQRAGNDQWAWCTVAAPGPAATTSACAHVSQLATGAAGFAPPPACASSGHHVMEAPGTGGAASIQGRPCPSPPPAVEEIDERGRGACPWSDPAALAHLHLHLPAMGHGAMAAVDELIASLDRMPDAALPLLPHWLSAVSSGSSSPLIMMARPGVAGQNCLAEANSVSAPAAPGRGGGVGEPGLLAGTHGSSQVATHSDGCGTLPPGGAAADAAAEFSWPPLPRVGLPFPSD